MADSVIDTQFTSGTVITSNWLNGVNDTVNYTPTQTGGVLRPLINRMADQVSVKDFGAVGDGIIDDVAAFQSVANIPTSGQTLTVYVPPGTYLLNSNVTAGAGKIRWHFEEGALLSGTGTLPFQKQTMAFNSSPNFGMRSNIWHGTDASPTTDGVVATSYIQRVDQSVTVDNPGNLISTQYITMKRLAGGVGWLYGTYNYLEDRSTTGAAQSVACAGAIHQVTSGAGWGIYGESNSYSSNATIQGGEFDCFNRSGVDYVFNHLSPFSQPFSMGVWSIGFGGNRNSIGVGIGASNSPQTTNSSWHVGIYMAPWSTIEYGIDIQAQPKTLIAFVNGASTDGTGITPGGIGLDCGIGAAYGTAANQGAIHLRDHRFAFGTDSYFSYNAGANYLEFWSAGVRRGYIDLSGADHAL